MATNKKFVIYNLKKVVRYTLLYGVRRTIAKIKSRQHMRSNDGFVGEWINGRGNERGDIALIGCGNFSFSTIAYYITTKTAGRIKYVLDVDTAKARSLARHYKAYKVIEDYEQIVSDPDVRLIFIASNHASHAEYAIRALEVASRFILKSPML